MSDWWYLYCEHCCWAGEMNTAYPAGCPQCGKPLMIERGTSAEKPTHKADGHLEGKLGSYDLLELPITHTRCNGIAFIYDHYPDKSERIESEYVVGDKPAPGAPMICNNCHERINTSELLVPKPLVQDSEVEFWDPT